MTMCMHNLIYVGKQLAGRALYMLLGFVLALTMFAFTAKAQTLVGGGVQIKNSASFHSDAADPGGFIYAETNFAKRFKAKGLFEFSSEPELPSIFQSDGAGTKMNGFEFRARPELQLTVATLGGIKPFVSFGVDYYRQNYPNLRQGLGHYRTGLNPLTSVGIDVGKHSVSVTRIWQELKVRGFDYYTFDAEDYGKYTHFEKIEGLRNKGTFNPSYLQGWQANYQYTRPLKGKWDFYFGAEAKYLDYRKSVDRTYVSYYRETDPVFAFRFGVLRRVR